MYAGTRFVLGYKKRHPGGGLMKRSIYPCADFVAHLSFREFGAKNPKKKKKNLSSQPCLLLAAYNRMR